LFLAPNSLDCHFGKFLRELKKGCFEYKEKSQRMSILTDLKMYARFALGLRRFLRHTISLDEAKKIVKQQMIDREKNFMHLIKRGIFGYPKSPYLPLLKLAGCGMGDIENMIRDKGLESTLLALREAGVYVTFEEFKGREPIVRKGKAIPVRLHDFDNPYLSHHYYGESSGTTGVGTRIEIDLDHHLAQTPSVMLCYDAHGVLHVPAAFWYGILPDITGVNNILRSALFGNVPKKWFSYIRKRDFKPSLKYLIATQYLIVMGRFFGVLIPSPESVPLDQAGMVARWAFETIKSYGACLVRTHTSMAVRVCAAAKEEGLDLTGTTFMGGGEPPTPAKVREIMRVGACWVPTYFFAETGSVGWGCAQPADGNDLHLFKHLSALIQYPRQVPGSEITIDAFHFTSLLPTAPKIMLNVESDDYGVIETRSCGCPLEGYGFTEHIRHVRSFRKLTGEGVTLVGNEMIKILEEVLPMRFGGSPLDYQLLEEEDEGGFTRLNLLVSPKIKIPNEEEIIEAVLNALGRSSVSADLAQSIWREAKTLRVKRMDPIWTARGKLMPLHLSQSSEDFSKKGEKQ
jgi:hypothetical protein